MRTVLRYLDTNGVWQVIGQGPKGDKGEKGDVGPSANLDMPQAWTEAHSWIPTRDVTILTVRSGTTQTADLQQWQNNAGTKLVSVSPAGRLTVNRAGINGGIALDQTYPTDHGHIYVEDTTTIVRFHAHYGRRFTQATTTAIGTIFQAVASQTGNITQWNNSAGSALSYVSPAGYFFEGTRRLIGAFGQHDPHGAYATTGFDGPSDFGSRYIQGTAAGPAIPGATQYYNFALGLGSEYSYAQYAMQWAVPRTPLGGNPYLSFRYRENGAWGAWQRVHAGYADTAGTATPNNDANLVHKDGAETISGVKTFSAAQTSINNQLSITNAAAAGQTALAFAAGGATQWFFYQAGAGTLYVRDIVNARMVASFNPGVAGSASTYVEDRLVIRSSASQTADIQQWQDSAGNILALVNSAGNFIGKAVNGTAASFTAESRFSTGAYTDPDAGVVRAIKVGSSGIAVLGGIKSDTITTTGNASVGVDFAVARDIALNRGDMAAAVNAALGIRFISDGNPRNFSFDNKVLIAGKSATTAVAQIRAAASQTADLTQWTNSADALLARVDASGFIYEGANRVYSAGNPPPVTDLSNYVTLDGAQTITGAKTFGAIPVVPDASFAVAKLSATGIRDATTFLRGDNTWATINISNMVTTDTAQTITGAKTFNAVITANGDIDLNNANSNGNRSIHTWTIGDNNWRIGMGSDNTGTIGAGAGFVRKYITTHVQFINYNNGVSQGFAVGPSASGGAVGSQLSHLEIRGSDGHTFIRNSLEVGGSNGLAGLTVGQPAGQTQDLTLWQNTVGNTIVQITNIGTFRSHGTLMELLGLAKPSGVTVTPQGTTGTTTYGYRVAAVNNYGVTVASATVTTTTGNATLDATNFNRITWGAVTGVTAYRVYGRTGGSELFIAEVAGTTYDDTGAIVPAGALPGAPAGNTLVIRGWEGQSQNLQQWRRFDDVVVARVRNDGYLMGAGLLSVNDSGPYIYTNSTTVMAQNRSAAGNIVFQVQGMASQTGDLQRWINSAGTSVASMTPNGTFLSTYARLGQTFDISATLSVIANAATVVPVKVRGAASQSADLMQFQDSAGNVLARISNDGTIYKGAEAVGGNAADTEIMAIMGAF